jgi:hypothetical protein
MENDPKNLINKDRTWRTVICLSPTHETVKFETNETGDIRCPLCESLMVVEVLPKWELYARKIE